MRRTNSFRRDDDKMLYLVKESVRRSSMSSLLVEAEPVPENEQVKYRTGSAKALGIMADAMRDAGFVTTAAAMTKGATLLRKNINVDEEEDEKTASLFALVPVLVSSLLSFLASIATQASADDKGDEATLRDVFGTDGALDATQLEKLISKNFKPNPGFMKWLKASKLGTAVTSGADWAAKKAEVGAAAESRHLGGRDLLSDDLFSSKFDALLQEGPFDFLKNLLKSLWSSTTPTSKMTVQSLVPLLGTTGIHKLLMQDMKKDASTIKISAVKGAFARVDSVRSRLAAGSPRPPAPSDTSDGGDGAGESPAASVPKPISASPAAVTGVTDALERVGGDAGVIAAARAGMSGNKEDLAAAYAELSRQQREFISTLLKQLADGAKPGPALRTAAADAPASAVTGDDDEMKFIDELPVKVLNLIKKHGGANAPKVIDTKITGDENLRRALDLESRLRSGKNLHENGQWVKWLLEDVPAAGGGFDAVKALTIAKGADGLGADDEITSDEAGEIVNAIKSAGGDRKKVKGFDELAQKLADAQTQVKSLDEEMKKLRPSAQETLVVQGALNKLASFFKITGDQLKNLAESDDFRLTVKVAGENKTVTSVEDLVRLSDVYFKKVGESEKTATEQKKEIELLQGITKELESKVKDATAAKNNLLNQLGIQAKELGELAAKVAAADLNRNLMGDKLKSVLEFLGVKEDDEAVDLLLKGEPFNVEVAGDTISIGNLEDLLKLFSKTVAERDQNVTNKQRLMGLVSDLTSILEKQDNELEDLKTRLSSADAALKSALERDRSKRNGVIDLIDAEIGKILDDSNPLDPKTEEDLLKLMIGSGNSVTLDGVTYSGLSGLSDLILSLLRKKNKESILAADFMKKVQGSLEETNESVSLSSAFGLRSPRGRKTTTVNQNDNESIIIERWQRLAGIIK